MNLMFWKKKTGAAEAADDARGTLAGNTNETSHFTAGEPGANEPDPESPVPENITGEAAPESPEKAGWAERIKSRFANLVRHFRKPPAFRAGEAHDSPAKAEITGEPIVDAPDPGVPFKPSLGVRIKLLLIAVVRRFRKTPAPEAEEAQEEKTDIASGEAETSAKPGLLQRIRAAFAAFARELKEPTPVSDEDEKGEGHGRTEASPEKAEAPAGEAGPVRSRKWLVVGGSAIIVLLLLSDIILTLWLAYTPQQKRWGTRHNITSISSRPPGSGVIQEEHATGDSQSEIEALRKRNAELQARIDALKKSAPQRQINGAPMPQTAGNAASLSASGEMTVDSKDPKATAMSLKEAIEAMNAATGDHGKDRPDEKKP